jgi:putative transposase
LFEADNPRPGKVSLTLKVDRGEIIRTWPSIQLYRKPRLLEILEAKPVNSKGNPRGWQHAVSEALGHKVNPRLMDSGVSRPITTGTIDKLSTAWEQYKAGKRRSPRFKRSGDMRTMSARVSDNNVKVDGGHIKLPKLGRLRVRSLEDRWPDGVPVKSYRIMKQPSGYYLLLVGDVPCETPKPSTKVAGFDAGVVHILNDDAGHHIDIPSPLKRRLQKIKRLSRKAARQEKGSANQKKTYALLALEHEKVRRDRKAWHHKLSTFAVRKYGAIAVEDLKLANMTRSPKAKPNAEGTGYERNMAAAKAGLNRSLLDAGIGGLYGMMEAKSKAFGREFARVNPAYTSQTCNACGVVDKASRRSQSEFVCTGCGHTTHADTNAARNIRDIAFPDHQERYLALAGKFKPAAACETQGQQEEAQVSPQGDALAISPQGALPKQRDLPDVTNFQPLKPSKLVRQKRQKNRSAQVAPETPVQLSVWEVAAETG